MPKRSTHTYSSEDAPDVSGSQLHVYYCAFTGAHAIITDMEMELFPRRKTDNSYIIDTRSHIVRLSGKEGGAKLLKRDDGKVERQFRVYCGDLPYAYRSEEGGRFVYVMDGAVSQYSGIGKQGGEAPIPPCIAKLSDGRVQIAVNIEERANKTCIVQVAADHVRLQISGQLITPGTSNNIVEFLAKVLGVRLSKMSILRGWSTRSKMIVVDGLSPKDVYTKLSNAVDKDDSEGRRPTGTGPDAGKYSDLPADGYGAY